MTEKHSEEWQEVNNAIIEENAALTEKKEPCLQDYSMNGVCPCCGCEVRTESHYGSADFGNGEEEIPFDQQFCQGCEWTSDRLYE